MSWSWMLSSVRQAAVWMDQHNGFITAISTIVIACFTWSLARSTTKLWEEAKRASEIAKASADAAKDSAEWAERAFLSTNRPRIRVKHLWLNYSEGGPSHPTGFHLVFANTGTTPANLVELKIQVLILPKDSKLPADPHCLGQPKPLSDRLASGMTAHIPDDVLQLVPFSDDNERNLVYGRTHVLYCFGDILYRDDVDGYRKTAFCRKLEIPSEPKRQEARFVTVDDRDYEYED